MYFISGVMEEIIKTVTLYLGRGVEVIAAIVIGFASIRALFLYLGDIFGKEKDTFNVPKDQIRIALGRSLALSLEFLLGADILKTAVAPTWNDIGMLAAIAVLRTALNYFLEKELKNAEKRHPGLEQKKEV